MYKAISQIQNAKLALRMALVLFSVTLTVFFFLLYLERNGAAIVTRRDRRDTGGGITNGVRAFVPAATKSIAASRTPSVLRMLLERA